jgi:hypothetical protein
MPGRCCYCLDDKLTVPVCLGCRTKMETALRESEARKKDAGLRKRGWNRKMRAVRASTRRAK